MKKGKNKISRNKNKEKFNRSKTHVNVGTIGHVGHGETSLTDAIVKLITKRRGNISTDKEEMKGK